MQWDKAAAAAAIDGSKKYQVIFGQKAMKGLAERHVQ